MNIQPILPKYSLAQIARLCRKLMNVQLPRVKTSLSPELISSMVECMQSSTGNPATHIICGSIFMQRLLDNKPLLERFEPTILHENVTAGFLGTLFGLDVLSEAYTSPEEQILDRFSLYVVSVSNVDDANILDAEGILLF